MPPSHENVAIFWDYENCPIPSNLTGYEVVHAIRRIAQDYGSVTLFKAYLEVSEQVLSARSLSLRSELQASGVSLTDCPHNGRKDVADKMMLVDMLAFAIDHPTPATFVLISGDRDFSYALSTLRLRRYRVVLITPPNTHVSLTTQASIRLHWNSDILDASSTASPSPKSLLKKDTTGSRVNFSSATELRKYTNTPPTRDSVSKPHSSGLLPAPGGFSDPEQTLVMGEGSTKKRPATRRLEQRHSVPNVLVSEDQKPRDTPSTFFGTPFKLPLQPLAIPRTPDSRHASTSAPPYSDRKGKSRESPPQQVQTPKSAPLKSYGGSPPAALDHDEYQDGYETESCCSTPPPGSELGGYDDEHNWEERDQESPEEPLSPRPRTSALNDSREDASVRSSSHSTTRSARQDGSYQTVPFRFKPLVKQLQQYRAKGTYIPQRSALAADLGKRYKRVYQNAGVEDFAEYVALAEQEGFVTLGGGDGANPWIMLRQEYVNITC